MCREVYVTMGGKMADVRDFEDFHMPPPFGCSVDVRNRQRGRNGPSLAVD